ncbi:MAG TPA: zinc ribbon domain-containing protein [Dehalococcoidia bacterium]|nr:zinc ribbon domain-containing protein [Dehalococcoidia bacterium]
MAVLPRCGKAADINCPRCHTRLPTESDVQFCPSCGQPM